MNIIIECQVSDSTGYKVKWSTGTSYDYSIDDVPKNEFNKIYVDSDNVKANAMWLASPSGSDAYCVMRVYYDGSVSYYDYDSYNGCDTGLRPLVCLKSGVQLNKVSDGVYEIVK